MAFDVDTMFEGMENASCEGGAGGNWFKGEGTREVKLKTIKMITSANPKTKGQKMVVAEFDVLKSNSAEDPAGSVRSKTVKLVGNDYAFGDLKSLAFALLGEDPSKVGSPEKNPEAHLVATKTVKAFCSEEYAKKVDIQPELFFGQVIGLTTWYKPAKDPTAKPYLKEKWFPLTEAAA